MTLKQHQKVVGSSGDPRPMWVRRGPAVPSCDGDSPAHPMAAAGVFLLPLRELPFKFSNSNQVSPKICAGLFQLL